MNYADYAAIGRRIRKLRIAQNLTQERLAEHAGISASFLGHIERGTRKMSLETLIHLSMSLHCTTDALLGIRQVDADALRRAADLLQELLSAELQRYIDSPNREY